METMMTMTVEFIFPKELSWKDNTRFVTKNQSFPFHSLWINDASKLAQVTEEEQSDNFLLAHETKSLQQKPPKKTRFYILP